MDGHDLAHRFQFHPADQDRGARHDGVRGACLEAAIRIDDLTVPCREQSLAITALEEAMMWANAAIAREGGPVPPG